MSWQPVNHLITYTQLTHTRTHTCTCSRAEMLLHNAATVCEERLDYLCPRFQSQRVAGGQSHRGHFRFCPRCQNSSHVAEKNNKTAAYAEQWYRKLHISSFLTHRLFFFLTSVFYLIAAHKGWIPLWTNTSAAHDSVLVSFFSVLFPALWLLVHPDVFHLFLVNLVSLLCESTLFFVTLLHVHVPLLCFCSCWIPGVIQFLVPLGRGFLLLVDWFLLLILPFTCEFVFMI